MYLCKYCDTEFTSMDCTPQHPCFAGKNNVYMEDNGIILFVSDSEESSRPTIDEPSTSEPYNSTKTKQQAIWDKHATMALLALYEANLDTLTHPKKKGKIWETISKGLLEFDIQMSENQVRWKMNTLMKRYKEVCDNNSKSGRGKIDFEWFETMDEFLRKKTAVTENAYTISSKCIAQTSSRPETKMCVASQKKDSIAAGNKKTQTHGTGTVIAKTKIELEKQWLKHLSLREERDKVKIEKNNQIIEVKKEAMKLKRRQLALKEKGIEQRTEIATSRSREKKRIHDDIVEIEKRKYKLLKTLIKGKENANSNSSDESD